MRSYYITISLFILFVFTSCVPAKYFSEIKKENEKCKAEQERLIAENEKLTVENTELKAKLEQTAAEIKRIEEGGFANAEELKAIKSRYAQLEKRYNDLQTTHQSLISGSSSETKALIGKLENTQRDLYQREDELNQLSAKLDKEKTELGRIKKELEARNARLIELQAILDNKDKAVEDLKQKISAALLGFENEGLTITKKNGKVYVSMDEKLLFKSGSTEVDARGKAALKKLAGVLEQNNEINITIEGHTDDVPVVSGSRYTDNWDLSVLRSTTIIRILLDGSSINPKRLTAAGRSQYLPVDQGKSADSRQKNRRTEIILTPNLDELYQLLEKTQ